MKKYISIFVLVAVLFVGVSHAKASTYDDVMAQIKSLQKQVSDLQVEISGLALKAVSAVKATATPAKVVVPPTVTAPKVTTPAIVTNSNPVKSTATIPCVGTDVHVISPNGGEVYTPGQTITVTWTDGCKMIPANDELVVYLDQASSVNSQWTASFKFAGKDLGNYYRAGNSTTFTLPVASQFYPGAFQYGTFYKILIQLVPPHTPGISANPDSTDSSDNFFSINPSNIINPSTVVSPKVSAVTPSSGARATSPVIVPIRACLPGMPSWIQVLSPNGGEVYQDGQQITIKWKTCNIPTTEQIGMQLQYYDINDLPIGAISFGSSVSVNDGIEIVTLPTISLIQTFNPNAISGQHFKVEVVRLVNPSIQDFSDNLFTINGPVASGNIYVADWGNYRVQKFDSNMNYVSQWGNNGMFLGTDSVAIAPSGNIYVSDHTNKIQEFTPNGTYVTQWGSYGTGNGQFNNQNGHSGIAIAPNGNVYVGDVETHRIQEFTSSGTYITQWSSPDSNIMYPWDIAIASNGNVYVTDYYSRILEFTSNGTYVTQWTGPGSCSGHFCNPHGIAIAPNGNVYVLDNFEAKEFDSSGNFILGWQFVNSGTYYGGNSIAIGSNGNVYITASDFSSVQEFTSSGTYVNGWGTSGNGNGQFNTPKGIAIRN